MYEVKNKNSNDLRWLFPEKKLSAEWQMLATKLGCSLEREKKKKDGYGQTPI